MSSNKVIFPITLCGDDQDFEVSAYSPPRALKYELQMVFPNLDLEKEKLVVVLTAQKARMKLLSWNDEIAQEKDLLLERFVEWAGVVIKHLKVTRGYWADWIDPCSGLPANTDGNKVYGEVDGFELLCGYKTSNAGCCKILLHPEWHSAVYPASFFTNAPADVVIEAIKMAQPPKRRAIELPAAKGSEETNM
jgi:hypothetical protein